MGLDIKVESIKCRAHRGADAARGAGGPTANRVGDWPRRSAEHLLRRRSPSCGGGDEGPAAAMRDLLVRQRTMLINDPSFKRTEKAKLWIVG